MFSGGTVAQFKAVLEEMKTVYCYDDEKTRLSTIDFCSRSPRSVQITTIDEPTGIRIMMEKSVDSDEP